VGPPATLRQAKSNVDSWSQLHVDPTPEVNSNDKANLGLSSTLSTSLRRKQQNFLINYIKLKTPCRPYWQEP